MNKDIRLVGFDIDETILNTKGVLPPRVAAAIEGSIARGITVLPATGRQLASIPPQVRALNGIRYAVTANGAYVYDLQKDTVLFSDCFPPPLALSVLAQVRTFETSFAIFLGGAAYTDDTRDPSFLAGALAPHLLQYLRTTRIKVPDLAPLIQNSADLVEKFSMNFADPQERARARQALKARGDITVTSSLGMNLELNTRTANKGAALLALAAHLGFSRAQVMAIGDGSNDIEMLKAVGWGVAMGNASADIRAAANAVTLSCDEDGVAEALESLW